MHSRLRFLHHMKLFDEAVTQKDRMSTVMVNRVSDTRPGSSEVHPANGVVPEGAK